MYCPKCGKEAPENSVFCPSCGADLSARFKSPAAHAAETVIKDDVPKKPSKLPLPAMILGLIGITAAIALWVIVQSTSSYSDGELASMIIFTVFAAVLTALSAVFGAIGLKKSLTHGPTKSVRGTVMCVIALITAVNSAGFIVNSFFG